MKAALALALLASSTFASMASAAVTGARINGLKNLQLEQAEIILEQQLGEQLSDQQKQKLAELAADDKNNQLYLVGNQPPEKSIYCVGAHVAGGSVIGRAVCLHFGTWKAYGVGFFGLGMAGSIAGSAFRLKVTFDSSRYDNSFDPIPGNYGFITQGLAVGLGGTAWSGSSGNKQVTGFGINLGLVFDYVSGGMLVIE